MKGIYRNRFFFGMFLFGTVFLLVVLNGCVAGKEASAPTLKIKDKKEVLVAQDIGRGGDISPPRWCGNNALLYEGDYIGIEMIDFIKKKRVQISDTRNDTALNCTPDGKWVLYESHSIMKAGKEGDMAFDEHIKKSGDIGVAASYIYRHEVSTGRSERVAAAGIDEGGSYEAISPDGTKILLGNRHLLNADIYAPEWKPVWFSNEWWERYDTRWFADSSGIAHIRNNPNSICVEFFGEGSWARCFELDMKYKDNIYGLLLDKGNRIYFSIGVGVLDSSGKHFIYRCEIKERDLKCEETPEIKGWFSPAPFLPDGDLIFQDKDCIRSAMSWEAEGKCIADRWYADVEYANISTVGVSPDGRWLAFERYRNSLKTSGGWSVWTIDLFVIDLKND